MIDRFPNFTAVGEIDVLEFTARTENHLPYSEFNLISLRCYWPSAGVARYSDGLIIRIGDYFTDEPFLSVLSHSLTDSRIAELIEYATESGCGARMRCVPACSISKLSQNRLVLTERRDSFDYILSVDSMLAGQHGAMRRKHRRADLFLSSNAGTSVREFRIDDSVCSAELERVTMAWSSVKFPPDSMVNTRENDAFLRCLSVARNSPLVFIGAFSALGEILGFTVNEVLQNGYYMAHFGRTLPNFPGLAAFLELETARYMRNRQCHSMNFQEDLGIDGLRQMKLSWQPSSFLCKYDIHQKYPC